MSKWAPIVTHFFRIRRCQFNDVHVPCSRIWRMAFARAKNGKSNERIDTILFRAKISVNGLGHIVQILGAVNIG